MGRDAAHMALCRLSPPHGVLAGYTPPGASDLGGLVPVTAKLVARERSERATARRRLVRRGGTPTPYGGFRLAVPHSVGCSLSLSYAHTHTHKGDTEHPALCGTVRHCRSAIYNILW